MEASALTRPPERLERIVTFLIPPAAREAVAGDLCETYHSPFQYVLEALRTVPLVVLSQMRRNANLPVLGLQAFLIFFCFGGFADSSASPGWAHAVLPGTAILGLLLRDAYQAIARPSSRRAMIEAMAIPYVALIFSQVMTLGLDVMQHMGPDLILWLRFGYLAPLLLPILCLLRTGVIVQGDGHRPFPADDVSKDDILRDYSLFERRVRRRNRSEAAALALATVLAVIFLRPNLSFGSVGVALMSVYALVALYLLFEGRAAPLPAGADFLSLRALYSRELIRRQQLRQFLWWLWLAPILIAAHAKMTQSGFTRDLSATTILGSAAAILLCFFIAALNREQGGWVQEKIGLLDRAQEKNVQDFC